MNQVDLNVSTLGVGKNVSSSTSNITTPTDAAESEGFLSELQSLLFGSDEVDGDNDESSKSSEDVESTVKVESDSAETTDMLLEAESDNETSINAKNSNAEEQLAEGNEFLTRLNDSNQALVSEETPVTTSNKTAIDDLGKELPHAAVSSEQSSQAPEDENERSQPLNDEKMAALFGATVATDVDTKAAVKLQQTNGERVNGDMALKNTSSDATSQPTKESSAQSLSTAGADSLQGVKAVPHGAESKHIDGALAASTAALGAAAHKNGDKVDHNTFAGQDGLTTQTALAATPQGSVSQQIKAEAQLSVTQQPAMQLSAQDASEKLSERMNIMISKNLKHVDIRLDPPELGKMHIRLHINNDQASVQFTVANSQARELIEQSLPRLRELMSQQGLQLADTDVQQQNRDQSGQYSYQKQEHVDSSENLSEESSEMVETTVRVRDPDKRISFYA